MKTIIFAVLVSVLFSCGGEDDPKPKFDCVQLNKDADRAHDLWQGYLDTPLNALWTDYEKEKYHKESNALKEDYIAKVKLVNQHCK